MHPSRSALCFALALTCGCASLKLNTASLDKVKSVAIVSIAMDNKIGSGGTDGKRHHGVDTAKSIAAISTLASGSEGSERRQLLEGIYDALAAKIGAVGFTASTRAALGADPKFVAAFAKIADSDDTAHDPGAFVLHGRRINLGKAETRKELFDALGVDALASAEITFETGKTDGVTVGGFGSLVRYPMARVTFRLYDRTNDDPIWIDYRVPGEPAHDGLRETMGFGDTSEATPLMTEAAGLAFDQLIAHYRASRQTPPKP